MKRKTMENAIKRKTHQENIPKKNFNPKYCTINL